MNDETTTTQHPKKEKGGYIFSVKNEKICICQDCLNDLLLSALNNKEKPDA